MSAEAALNYACFAAGVWCGAVIMYVGAMMCLRKEIARLEAEIDRRLALMGEPRNTITKGYA